VLAQALETKLPASVSVEISDNGPAPDTALGALLSLEKLLLRGSRPCWSDRISRGELSQWLTPAPADVVIDLTSEGVDAGEATLFRPLFDGGMGETALASALFLRGTPQIAVERAEPGRAPCIVASGTASLEAAAGIGGGMEAVWSRVAVLLLKAIRRGGEGWAEVPPPTPAAQLPRMQAMHRAAKLVASAAARAAYRLSCHPGHWRIGWRRAGYEDDVWARRDLGGAVWNVLADPNDHFYADPFPFFWKGRDYLFFEDLDHKTQKGVISVVDFDDEGRPGPVVPVLEEPWHLSYPFVIAVDGQIWMIPEASLSGAVAIYRATDFPYRWERHATLISGVEAADATVVWHEGRYYMFAVTREGVGGYSDTLDIWQAPDLLGPWRPLPANPVLVDDRSARPAGAFVLRGGRLMRPVQDCRGGYGIGLGLAHVTRLDPGGFAQTVETRLFPGLPHWPGRKLHTLNGNGRLEVIDGSVLRPRLAAATAIVERRNRPS